MLHAKCNSYFMSKSTMIGRWSEGRQKLDRFCGSLILTGEREDIKSAVYEIVRYFGEDLGYPVCNVTEQW